jgi:hypothetical protein
MKTKHTIMAMSIAALACVAFTAPQALPTTVLAVAILGGVATIAYRTSRLRVCNNAFFEEVGITEHKAFKLDAAVTAGTLVFLVKKGSDNNHVAVCGAADKPIGVVYNEGGGAVAAEQYATVHFFGDIIKVAASDAIGLGDQVHTAASGKVAPEPTAAGTTYLIGQSLGVAAADGDIIQLLTHAPIEFKTVANGSTLSTTQGGMTGGIVKVL